ncbi:MAG: rhomboid family intramembrane serine protease [Negativicutes bacterium]|nr:rhomboid family intramembrane serine protease [Negativicutes bacterium]
MIPVRDSIRAKHWPVMTLILIAVNTLIFIWSTTLSARDLILLDRVYGMTPAYFSGASDWPFAGIPFWLTLVTAQFIHGGWGHLLGNVLYLWIFGDNVEDKLGCWRFLLMYLCSGLIGNLLQIATEPASMTPVIGASGAIAGVLGAYFMMFPRAKIRTIIPFFVLFLVPFNVPAVVYLGIWFLLQVSSGRQVMAGAGQNVAYWVHVGGFLFGAAVGYWYNQTKKRNPEPLDFWQDDADSDETFH